MSTLYLAVGARLSSIGASNHSKSGRWARPWPPLRSAPKRRRHRQAGKEGLARGHAQRRGAIRAIKHDAAIRQALHGWGLSERVRVRRSNKTDDADRASAQGRWVCESPALTLRQGLRPDPRAVWRQGAARHHGKAWGSRLSESGRYGRSVRCSGHSMRRYARRRLKVRGSRQPGLGVPTMASSTPRSGRGFRWRTGTRRACRRASRTEHAPAFPAGRRGRGSFPT